MTEQLSSADEAGAPKKRSIRAAPIYVIRTAGKPSGLTPDGLALVENLAGFGKSETYIASKLGIVKAAFRKLLGEPSNENQIRLRWESGFAKYEDRKVKLMERHAEKNFIPAIFLAKARLGWRDSAQPAPLVENRIQLTLPLPMSTEQFYKMVGQTGPLDYRTPRGKADAAERAAEIADEQRPALPAPIIDVESVEVPLAPEPPRSVSRTRAAILKGQGKWRPDVDMIDEGLE